ncbi:flagellar hook-associated protein FlgL [Bacillaceae bacterium]
MSLRVTQGMLNKQMLANLSNSYRALGKYQDQLASGKKINKPSDDPVVAVRGMYYRSTLMEIEQFKRNAEQGQSWMELTDEALGQATDVLQRVRELVVQGSNGTFEQSSLDAIAAEIEQLKEHLGEIANTSIAGRYIFAGTDTLTPPYDAASGSFTNQNGDPIRLEVNKGEYVKINVNGTDVFKFSVTDSDGTNYDGIFEVLDGIISDLRNGVSPGKYLDVLDKQTDHILAERAALGARMNRMELTISRLDQSEVTAKKLLSEAEDADMAKVITELKAQENVHRAALAAGARIIQPTLVDFLR